MAYKDDRSDSLQLIPNGVGFDDSTPQMSVEQLAEIFQGRILREDTEKLNLLFQKEASDEAIEEILKGFRDLLNNERKQLLRLCGYTVRTDSEAQNILYLKPLFILQNSKWFYSEFPASKYQSIVNILLSDPCVLFTDADEHFRHSRINNEAISAWNPLFYDTKKRRDYCNMHADNISKQFQEKDMPLYKTMLDKISKSAVKKHQNIQDWIRKHLPYDESDIDKNLVQLKEVFPEYADQITPNFSENFFLLALPRYANKVAMLSNDEFRPDRLPASVDQETAQLFVYYKARLRRFENLQSKACEQEKSLKPIRAFLECRPFSLSTTREERDAHIEHIAEIIAAIHDFFIQCSSLLKDDNNGTLQRRIVWAMNQRSIPSKLQPVFLIYMTICCNRNLAIGADCPIQPFPIFDLRYNKRKQRHFQLVLLNRLCDILSISKKDRMENWKQYLALQGVTILSVEEAQFWKQQLGIEYEQFPVIGFQLCCADYIEECMPLHLKYLSYNSVSPLHLGGYHDFWEQNQEDIRLRAGDLKKHHPEILKMYKKFWNKPKEYYFERKEWLENVLEHDIPVDLSVFVNIPACNKNELQRLVLETELQLCLISDARSKLQKMCVDAYHIENGLFTSFRQKGHSTGM